MDYEKQIPSRAYTANSRLSDQMVGRREEVWFGNADKLNVRDPLRSPQMII